MNIAFVGRSSFCFFVENAVLFTINCMEGTGYERSWSLTELVSACLSCLYAFNDGRQHE